MCNNNSCGNGFDCWWIILILLCIFFCCGCGNNGISAYNNNSCDCC